MTNIHTIVIDAGGRYGLHPSWKPFSGELKYFLFEPDLQEAERLKTKYADRSDEIIVDQRALSDSDAGITINILKNRAMSTSYARDPKLEFFSGERKEQVEVVEKLEVDTITIDSYCHDNQLKADFLKLDVEGNEYKILQGSSFQLNNLLGVRCEVNFDRIFEGMPTFAEIHDFMLNKNFFLLNLDYNGRGFLCNEFADANGRYGIIQDCDAVWVRRLKDVFDSNDSEDGMQQVPILKYAAFCMNNNAPDLAVHILLEARQELTISYEPLKNTKLYSFLCVALHKHFYTLKWQPGQSLRKHQEAFQAIFDEPMMELNDYNQSIELNPD